MALKLNSELRWKAFLRQQVRAVYDLFHFGGYVTQKEHGLGLNGRKEISRKLLKDAHINALVGNARVRDLQNKEKSATENESRVRGQFMGVHGGTRVGVISLDEKESMSPFKRADLFRTAWHEIAHEQSSSKFNPNNFALAHALGSYFENLNYPSFAYGNGLNLERVVIGEETARLLGKTFSAGVATQAIKSAGWDYRKAEYGPAFLGSKKSFAEIGASLGELAMRIEWGLGIPGAGLIFIREVSRGRPVLEVQKEISLRKTKHVNELTAWFKRHPSIKRFVLKPATRPQFLAQQLKREKTARTMLKKTLKRTTVKRRR